MDLPFINAMLFFKNYEIPFDESIDNYFGMFEKIFKFYSKMLRKSIKKARKSSSTSKLFYTYLICDGKKLLELLAEFDALSLENKLPSTEQFARFLELIDYAGKGTDVRMYSHLENSKKVQLKILKKSKICARYSKICKLWENGNGVTVIRLFGEFNNEEALSREFSLIKAIGLNNLTNKIGGTCYGDMRYSWSETEIINFGNCLLMNTLKSIINENPEVIMDFNVKVKSNLDRINLTKWEIDGMLQCLVDL